MKKKKTNWKKQYNKLLKKHNELLEKHEDMSEELNGQVRALKQIAKNHEESSKTKSNEIVILEQQKLILHSVIVKNINMINPEHVILLAGTGDIGEGRNLLMVEDLKTDEL